MHVLTMQTCVQTKTDIHNAYVCFATRCRQVLVTVQSMLKLFDTSYVLSTAD